MSIENLLTTQEHLAHLIAEESDEKVSGRHFNEALKIIWPYLSQATQGQLILR